MIGKSRGEDLGFVLQTPERAGMNHAVPVALKCVAIGVFGLRVLASKALADWEPESRQHGGRAGLLLRHLGDLRHGHVADGVNETDAQRLKQLAGFGWVLMNQVLGERQGGLILGHEDRGMGHQIA